MRLRLDSGASWETLSELEAGLQSVALVARPGGLHRVGGMRVVAEGQLTSVDEHARFHQGRWTPLPPLPEPRSSHDAVAHGEAIYVVGGWRLTGRSREGEFHDELWVYTAEGGWKRRPSPVRRRALALAATGEHLVAIGGLGPDGDVSARVDVYEIATASWTDGPAFPGDGFGVAAVGAGDRIYASGRDGIVWSWRVGDDSWKRIGELVFPRFSHRLLSPSPGTLVAVGGIDGMHTFGRTRHVEKVVLGDNDGASVVLWTLPSPGKSETS